MSNSVKSCPKKSYYLPGDPSRTPLTHEEFCDIMRPFWKERKRLERAGLCNPPARHACMCDCADCPYSRRGNTVNMDTLELIGEEVADPFSMEDDISDFRAMKCEGGPLSSIDCIFPRRNPCKKCGG